MLETDERIQDLERERDSIQSSIKASNNLFISDEANNLVLTPRNFNLEMHKLGFKIVVGEYSLNTEGLSDKAPEWQYLGYSRKKRAYEWEVLGKKVLYANCKFQ